jgi:hypothetical protein
MRRLKSTHSRCSRGALICFVFKSDVNLAELQKKNRAHFYFVFIAFLVVS